MKKTYVIPHETCVELETASLIADSLKTDPEHNAETGTGEDGGDVMETKAERNGLWDNW